LLRRLTVSLNCPLTEETHHPDWPGLLSFRNQRRTINMARGPVVDQSALYQALVDDVIQGAALDVLEQEPPAPNDPLLKLDNVILTPHTSSWTAEAGVQLRRDAARNVVDVLQGRLPRSIVNRRELQLEALEKSSFLPFPNQP
jgi:D-3-phosphoglycerate dehydrogenase